MRQELHHIERIEQYLQGSMDPSEKILFEKELAVNPELKDAVDTQSLMVTAISRKALLAQVETFAPPTGPRSGSGSQSILSKFKWPIVLSSVVTAAIISWFATRKGSDDDALAAKNNAASAQIDQLDSKHNNVQTGSIPDISLPVDFTYNPAHGTEIHRSAQREFGGLLPWVRPELQTVYIDPKKDELIQCKEGTVILVPKGSFVDQAGNIVKTPVAMEIIEALTVDKMIAYNLTTMRDDMALRSAGMVYIQPKLGDSKLSLAEGKSIHIEIPTDNFDTAMMAWEGVPDGNGNINWENPKQLENYLIPVPINTLDFLPYGFRDEVQATLPFKSHRVSSVELEDSLYYSLSGTMISTSRGGEAQPFELPIPVGSAPVEQPTSDFSNRNLEIKPGMGRGKAKDGRGSLFFSKLVANEYYEVIVYFDNYTFNSEVRASKDPTKGQVSVPRVGKCTIALQRSGCDPVVFNNVELSNDETVFLENPGAVCDAKETKKLTMATNQASTYEQCYIDPSAIYAIHQEKFENTFVATKEFQDRLQVLHTLKNGEELLNLYLNQLGKNMHEIDAQVATKVSGAAKTAFTRFAAQKLTNVKPDGQDYAVLKQFYTQELKKQQQEVQSRHDAYKQKTDAELAEIRAEFDALKASFQQKQSAVIQKYAPKNTGTGVAPPILPARKTSSFVSAFSRNNSNPSVARQAAYKVNWFGTGWMNIDAYAKQLSSGERVVALNVTEPREGQKVYTTINSLKTVLPLNQMANGYEAHFPKFEDEIYRNTAAFAIKRKGRNRIEMAVVTYNPYVRSTVTLNDWKEYSEDEFLQVLKDLNPSTQQLVIQMGREKLRIHQEEERRKRAQELEEHKQAELNALQEEFTAAQQALDSEQKRLLEKQQQEQQFIQHLENTINPCYENYIDPNQIGKQYMNRTDNPEIGDAEFPGGYEALQRFLADNLDYPEEALKKQLQGTVEIELILDQQGNIVRRRVMNITPGMELLEAEALRLVDRMPRWSPGNDKNGPVGIRYRFPIQFKIEE